MTLVEQFDQIQRDTGNFPWCTQILVDGKPYGGQNSYAEDPRVSDFLGWTPPYQLSNIIELGSCEAGQTIELLKNEFVQKINGVEGKPWLVKRATEVASILKLNATFTKCNFDDAKDLKWLSTQRATAVFCSGVLYHLEEPWKLIEALVPVTEWLYIASHFTFEPTLRKKTYMGLEHPETRVEDPWSGICNTSFWFDLPSFIQCLLDFGWKPNLMRVWPFWSPTDFRPMVGVLCNRG